MNIKKYLVLVTLTAFLLFPSMGLAATNIKTITGTVTRISGNSVYFSTTSAANYLAEIGNAALLRKNGVSMTLSQILVGDKVEVKGTLWPDNSINAVSLRNLSFYTHTGTFTGKITSINPVDSSFIMQNNANGAQTIHSNNFTTWTKNGKSSGFQDLQIAMTAKVKGVWDRSNKDIAASSVTGTYKLINIYFTGTLQMKSDTSLTVVGNGNVLYGVDISKAVLQSKNGKTMTVAEFNLGDTLRVWGKHISGMPQVAATQIKDNSVSK